MNSSNLLPTFKPTQQMYSILSAKNSNLFEAKIISSIDKGFFKGTNDEWICYRRNYFSVSAGFSLVDKDNISHDESMLIQVDNELIPILQFSIGIRAQSLDGSKLIPLVQQTAKRDKGPQMIPHPIPVAVGGNPNSDVQYKQQIANFERLQFKISTSGAGRKKGIPPFYALVIELYAILPDHSQILCAISESCPLVVRGRSPNHYLDINIPHYGSSLSSAISSSSALNSASVYSKFHSFSPASITSAPLYSQQNASSMGPSVFKDIAPKVHSVSGNFHQITPDSASENQLAFMFNRDRSISNVSNSSNVSFVSLDDLNFGNDISVNNSDFLSLLNFSEFNIDNGSSSIINEIFTNDGLNYDYFQESNIDNNFKMSNISYSIERIVPWINSLEWETIYSNLYSKDPNNRMMALDRIKAWHSRGKVPHAIDATATFVEIQLSDSLQSIPDTQLQLLYSIAFIRFINGLIDPLQKGVYAGSMSGIAESLGLPSWFVELRHASTHDSLPSLVLLRNGCNHALIWLNDNYWKLQKIIKVNLVQLSTEILQQYKDAQKKNSKLLKDDIVNQQDLQAQLKELFTNDSAKEILIPILLETGFLIPNFKKKRANFMEFKLPIELENIWSLLLDEFEQEWPGFYHELFLEIIKLLLSWDSDYNYEKRNSKSTLSTLCAWGGFIIKTHISSTHQLQPTQSSIKIKNILQECIPNSHNVFIQFLLKQFCEFLPEFDDIINNGQSNSEKRHLPIDLNEIDKMENAKIPCKIVPGWKKLSKWKTCPIGLMPGNSFNLDLPNEYQNSEFIKKFATCVPMDTGDEIQDIQAEIKLEETKPKGRVMLL